MNIARKNKNHFLFQCPHIKRSVSNDPLVRGEHDASSVMYWLQNKKNGHLYNQGPLMMHICSRQLTKTIEYIKSILCTNRSKMVSLYREIAYKNCISVSSCHIKHLQHFPWKTPLDVSRGRFVKIASSRLEGFLHMQLFRVHPVF